jgi:hypothetical protein
MRGHRLTLSVAPRLATGRRKSNAVDGAAGGDVPVVLLGASQATAWVDIDLSSDNYQ